MTMPSMTTYKFADVVLVAFPFTNLKTTKQRPAVIISHHHYQQHRPDVILMAITSQVRLPLSFGEQMVDDWQLAGLLKPSLLKPLIATVEKTQIVRCMGQLSEADKQRLNIVLSNILGN